jgi:hypothetical protein
MSPFPTAVAVAAPNVGIYNASSRVAGPLLLNQAQLCAALLCQATMALPQNFSPLSDVTSQQLMVAREVELQSAR